MNASVLRILFNAGSRLQVETADTGGAGGRQRPQRPLPGLDLTLAEWQSDSFPFRDFDRFAETLAADAPGGAFEIRLSGEARRLAAAARQVVTRCQRLAARRNAASACDLFERALAGHRRLHDRTRPPAASVYAHALDTWQWLLRLDPEAGLAPQLAALFHDVGRLGAEAGTPGGAGAWVTDELLAELDVDLAVRVRVHRLIHGRRPAFNAADPFAAEIALLDDADALSFFSFESAAYLDDFGAEQAARQVAHTLARLRPASRTLLTGLRLRTAVARLLERELGRRAVQIPDGAGSAVAAGPMRGAKPSRAIAIARSRMAAGMAGGAGIARTRTGALLARAAALGALAAPPRRPRAAAPGTRPLPGAVAAPQRDLAKA
ncbi:MAG TPA: hypothetical protein VHB47_06795 [Thermoanaerobaculia bacterium]|jgi:hypothetical protein|nr:hypothetical protein [Thermoanaerobaculia bacterium]